jgi:hypothetical protein
MGVDVWAMRKAELVRCRGEESHSDDHCYVAPYRKRLDGLRSGCYKVGKGGRDFGYRVGSYLDFDQWRRELSIMALGVLPEETWTHPRQYREKPFIELIDFPDSSGSAIGSKTATKLHTDFVAHSSRANKHFLDSRIRSEAHLRVPKNTRIPKKRHINRLGVEAQMMAAKILRADNMTVGDDGEWMWAVYRAFRKAFSLASNHGFVCLC